ncbi:MAG: YihY/virulence factor BrkB family protein [Verrucomicrobiaceae bacterium]|nr:YihY/virulence factor BrkB family protein [Verrucomicrobiaceae bacterium]
MFERKKKQQLKKENAMANVNSKKNINPSSAQLHSRRISLREFGQTLWDAAQAWLDHNAASMGAAVAYYTIFSLAPLLLMLIAIAGFVLGNDVAQGAILRQFEGLIGSNGAQAVQAILKGASSISGGVISIFISAITLFIGATSVFAELQRNIDFIWGVVPKSGSGVFRFFKIRLLSFALIVGVGFLLIVSLAVSAGLAALASLWGSWFKEWETILQIANVLISFVVITVLFALIYKVLPSSTIAWGDVWLGAAFTSLLFALGKFAIGLYIGKSALSSSFGAAGAFVILIVWVYYSAQIFFLGTEFTYLFATRFGSRQPALVKSVDAAQKIKSINETSHA